MKVLHVVPAVAERYGGPSAAVVEMCRAQIAMGLEPLVATTDADGPGRLEVSIGQATEFDGVPAIFFPAALGESLKFSVGLAGWLRSNVSSFDLVHIHGVFSHSSLSAGSAARRSGVPYVVRPLGQLDRWSLAQHAVRKSVFLHVGGQQLIRGAAAIHWTEESERERAPAFASSLSCIVVPLGVDEALFAAPEGDEQERRRTVLFLSRLHPKKNVETLIRAFLSVAEGAQEWTLAVAGHGERPYVESLQALAARLEGGERVEFLGWLAGEEKSRALRQAGLFALPSSQENFGIAVAEAMATGTPVLISDAVALAREVRRARAGWVVSLEGDGLRAGLEEALSSEDERRRRGSAARLLAETRFRWSGVVRQLADEYEKLRQGRHAA